MHESDDYEFGSVNVHEGKSEHILDAVPYISAGRMTEYICCAGRTWDEELNTYAWDAKKQGWVKENAIS